MTRSAHDLMHTYLTEIAIKGRLDLISEIAHPDMVDEANQAFGGPPGRAGLEAHIRGFTRAFDDLETTIHRIVAQEDAVMAWWEFTGTHVGPWLNRAPTHGPLSGTVFSFFTLEHGKISHYRLWLCAMFDPPVVFDSSRPELFKG